MGLSGCEQHTGIVDICQHFAFLFGRKRELGGLKYSHRGKSKGAAKKNNGGPASTTLNQADTHSVNCDNSWFIVLDSRVTVQ